MSDPLINKKLFDKIANKIRQGLEKREENPRLVEVSKLEDFKDEDIRTILTAFYQSGDPIYERIGVILNAVFTHGHNVFIISKAYLNDLMAKDPNIKANTCDTDMYKKVMKAMYEDKIMACLRKAVQQTHGVPGKNGLYELIDRDYLGALSKTLGENTLLAKREQFIQWFDTHNPEQEEPYILTDEDRAKLRKAKEKADEIYNRK